MAINGQVKFTWVGHGTWRVRSVDGREILIDPWVMNNPYAPEHLKTVDRCDVMLVSHGHFDHIYDALEIGKQTSPTLVTMHETAAWLGSKGFPGAGDNVINKGGTLELDGIRITMVHAEHSCGIQDGDRIVYGGEPCGFVIEFENGFTIYFAGDTDVFGDMRLYGELHRLDAAFLPIGDHFTMGPKRAAKAVELLGVRTVVPMHFGTFPVLTGHPDRLRELVGDGVQVLEVEPGGEV